MKVTFIKEFTYWHNGYEAKVYGLGEADVPEEVASVASLCGALAEPQKDKQAEPVKSKTTKGKK